MMTIGLVVTVNATVNATLRSAHIFTHAHWIFSQVFSSKTWPERESAEETETDNKRKTRWPFRQFLVRALHKLRVEVLIWFLKHLLQPSFYTTVWLTYMRLPQQVRPPKSEGHRLYRPSLLTLPWSIHTRTLSGRRRVEEGVEERRRTEKSTGKRRRIEGERRWKEVDAAERPREE